MSIFKIGPFNNRRASIGLAQTRRSLNNLQLLNPLNSTSKSFNDKVKTILIPDCKSFKDIISFTSELLSKEVINSDKVLILKFKCIEINFPLLSQDDLQELNWILFPYDVVVVLDGEISTISMIYWRGKAFKDLLFLKPYCDGIRAENPVLNQFIVNFLAQCLYDGQSGEN